MKLLTKEIIKKLMKNDAEIMAKGNCKDKGTVVKFFDPTGSASWFINSGTPLDARGEPVKDPKDAKDWHLFGRCDLFGNGGELGYVLLSQLQDFHKHKKGFAIPVERDRNYTDDDFRFHEK